jgi:hypothetical protein
LSSETNIPGEDSLARAEALLARLEQVRAELEQAAGGENAEAAIDILNELAELAKAVEAELGRARREAESGLS